jgi:hypothetical protein
MRSAALRKRRAWATSSPSLGVIGRFDALDLDHHAGMDALDVLDEFVLLAGRPDDQDRLGVGDRLGHLFEKALVFGEAAPGALLAALEIAHGMLGVDDDLVGVFAAEMENAGQAMVDPDDGVVLALHRARSSPFFIFYMKAQKA